MSDRTPDGPAQRDGDGDSSGLHEEDGARRGGWGSRSWGVAIGLAAAAALALGVFVLFAWGPFAPRQIAQAPPDNTVPVTTLPQGTEAVPSNLPVATPTVFTNDPGASQTQQPQGDLPVALSRWSWVPELNGFSAAGYIASAESGGQCTLTVTNGLTTVQGTAEAQQSVSTTNCIVNVPVPDAEPGQWRLSISYEGPGGAGSSETVVVSVP